MCRHCKETLQSMMDFIQFGSRQIDFHLTFSERKTLGITVTPDFNVLVKAPINAQLDRVKQKIRKKAPWIIKQQNFFLSFHPKTPPRKYIGEETHLYLGRQYQLKIKMGRTNAVTYKGRYYYQGLERKQLEC